MSKKKILVVVDMQNDFIDGTLGTPEAKSIVDNVCKKIIDNKWDNIYLTMDTHYSDYLITQEGIKLPVFHCLWSSKGWCINSEIIKALTYSLDYNPHSLELEKETFGCIDLINELVKRNDIRLFFYVNKENAYVLKKQK